MADLEHLIQVGYYKGEMDFGVRSTVAELTYEQMNELRIMTIVAIGQMEAMWSRAQEEKDRPNQAQKASLKDKE